MRVERDNIQGILAIDLYVDLDESHIDAYRLASKLFHDEVIPRQEACRWDYIRIEIWSDSGRVIIFPADSGRKERIDVALIDIHFADLLAKFDEYEELPDSIADNPIVEAEYIEAFQSWISEFPDAARLLLAGHRVKCFEFDAPDPFREFVL